MLQRGRLISTRTFWLRPSFSPQAPQITDARFFRLQSPAPKKSRFSITVFILALQVRESDEKLALLRLVQELLLTEFVDQRRRDVDTCLLQPKANPV